MTALPAYRVPRHPAPVSLRLDGNEGRCCLPPEEIAQALEGLDLERYPQPHVLEAKLAERHGLRPEQVLVTAGADQALMRAARLDLGPDRPLVLPSPSFEMLPRFAQWAGAQTRRVPWEAEPFPLEHVLHASEGAGAIAVVSPNNPTGAVISQQALDRLCALERPIWLDHAYVEYRQGPPLSARSPWITELRTLSKAWGLAGLRIGYALGAPARIAQLRACGLPYPVSGASVAVALRALDRGEIAGTVQQVQWERSHLHSLLGGLGMNPHPSQGNFVFARTPRAWWLRDALASQGIGVRAWPDTPGLQDALRVTCPGDPPTFLRLCEALRTAAAPQALVSAGELGEVPERLGVPGLPWSERRRPGAWVICETTEQLREAPEALRLFVGDANEDPLSQGAARVLPTLNALEALCHD